MGESSFGSYVTTEDTTKHHDEYKDEVVQIPKDKNENNSFYETLLNKNMNDNNSNNNKSNSKSKKGGVKSVESCIKDRQLPTYSPERSSFQGSRASHMFRKWITCKTANTNETAVVVINKRKGSRISTVSSFSENISNENDVELIRKEQKFADFEQSFNGKMGSKKSKEESKSNTTKTYGAAYKPVNGPNCSQCGRQFNPEKLYNHMKYCRGMKAMAKSTNSRPRPTTSTPFSPSSASQETFLLDK